MLWAGVPALPNDPPLSPPTRDHDHPPPTDLPVSTAPAFPPASSTSTPSLVSLPLEPLHVDRFGPTGDVEFVDAIRVTFDQSMVPLDTVDRLTNLPPPLRIEPATPGEFRWLGTRTVGFFPVERLPYSTTYRVTVPADMRSIHDRSLEQPLSFSFTTPPLRLERSMPIAKLRDTSLDPEIVWVFNQRVDAQRVQAAFVLSDGSHRYAVDAVPESDWSPAVRSFLEYDATDRRRVIVVRPREPLAPHERYKLRLPSGVYGEGPNPSTEFRAEFFTYPPFRVEPSRYAPARPYASDGFTLKSTTPVADQASCAESFRVQPAVADLTVRCRDSLIRLQGSFAAQTKYEIHISPELRDRFDQPLVDPRPLVVRTGTLRPQVAFQSTVSLPAIVEVQGSKTVSLYVSGRNRVDLRARRFGLEEVRRYLTGNWQRGSDQQLEPPAVVKRLSTRASLREPMRLPVDLGAMFGNEPGFLAVTADGGPPSPRGHRFEVTAHEIVQVTDLGIAAAFDSDSGVVFVTSLHTGQPVSGAQLQIVEQAKSSASLAQGRSPAGAVRWFGRTDASGFAYPRLARFSHRPLVVTARADDDAAFLVLEHGASTLPSWSGQAGRAPIRIPEVLVFSDRSPYKPGDTVHLAGIARQRDPTDGNTLNAIVESGVPYKLVDPRKRIVTRGKLDINALGLFSVDLELAANASTGDYRFELELPSRQNIAPVEYRFSVETYRVPEFELAVARDRAEPLCIGDELGAHVQGQYMYGTPTVGAVVGYEVRYQPTAFVPPGPDSHRFAFTSPHSAHPRGEELDSATEQIVHTGVGRLDSRGRLAIDYRLDPPAVSSPADGDLRASKAPATDTFAPAVYTIRATGNLDNGQAIHTREEYVVHPALHYVGVRTSASVIEAGQQAQVEAIVTDLAGQRLANRPVEIEVQTTIPPSPSSLRGPPSSAPDFTPSVIGRCRLVSSAVPATCDIVVPQSGRFDVVARITDEGGRVNEARSRLYVAGPNLTAWSHGSEHVDLVADKPRYTPGDTAQILISAPFPNARGMLVVDRRGLVQTVPLELGGSTRLHKLEIGEELIGGATVSVLLVKPRTSPTPSGSSSSAVPERPIAAVGSLELAVSSERRRVHVEVTPTPHQVAPGQTVGLDFRMHVDNQPVAASMVVMVVDEAVLGLMGHELPDPLAYFYPQPDPGVGLYATQPYVLDPFVPRPDHDGGDESKRGMSWRRGPMGWQFGSDSPWLRYAAFAGGERHHGMPAGTPFGSAPSAFGMITLQSRSQAHEAHATSLRTLFATTAYFNANVQSDEHGRAHVDVSLPDNLTTYRVMVMAVDAHDVRQVGHGESSVVVRKPLMLRPSLPRFLNDGDRFEAVVSVENQSEHEQDVLVGVRGRNVVAPDEDHRRVVVPAHASHDVRFSLATERPGDMTLQFAAVGARADAPDEPLRDATQHQLSVHEPATRMAFADYGRADTGIVRNISVPAGVRADFGGLELSLSSTALIGLQDAAEYLHDYPYDAAESVASRLLSVMALDPVLEQFRGDRSASPADHKALVTAQLRKLLSFQGDDGGFRPFTNSTGRSSSHLTNWATLALLESKRRGQRVPAHRLQRALAYLDRHAERGSSRDTTTLVDWTNRAFAVWLLSSQRKQVPSFANVWRHRKDMTFYARAMLTSAARRLGRHREFAQGLAELRRAAIEDAGTVRFAESTREADVSARRQLMHSSVQTDAVILLVLLEIDPEDELLGKLVAGILAQRDAQAGGRWETTHANAWALLAVGRYFEQVERELPNFVAGLWLGPAFVGEERFDHREQSRRQWALPMSQLLDTPANQLSIAKQGNGPLYYRLGLRYAPIEPVQTARDHGFVVYHRYVALPDATYLDANGRAQVRPNAVAQDADGNWTIQHGTDLRVDMTLVIPHRAEHVVVEDPLPAGLEGDNRRFATSRGHGDEQGFNSGEDELWGSAGPEPSSWWTEATFDHMEMRDDRVVWIAEHVDAGVYTFSYFARATTVGTYQGAPTHAEAQYEPERFGHSASAVVRVVP